MINGLMKCFFFFLLPLILMAQDQAAYEEEGGKNYRHSGAEASGFQQPRSRCNEWEFTCKDGNCIARYDQCDGVDQCPDGSDEEDCQHRYEQHPHPSHQNQDDQEHSKDAVHHPASQHQTTNPSPQHKATNNYGGERRVPMELLLIGASAFVIVAVLVHILMKTKRRRGLRNGGGMSRGFRKGESLIDDEDDMLISQAYSGGNSNS